VAQIILPTVPAKILKKIFSFQMLARYQAGIITASDGTGTRLDSKAIRKTIVA